MDLNNKILDLISGELSPEFEEQLYLNLASNESLRNEARDFLTIKSALRENAGGFVPPVHLKDNIYNSVHSSVFPKPQTAAKIKSNKNFLYFSAGVLSTFLILFFTYVSGLIPSNVTPANNINNRIDKTENTKSFTGSKPLINKIKIHDNLLKEPARKISSSLTAFNTIPVETNLINHDIKPSTYTLLDYSDIESSSWSDIYYNESEFTYLPNIHPYDLGELSALEYFMGKNYNMLISVSGAQSWFFSSNPESVGAPSYLNNASLALFYKLTEYFSLGVEIRKEEFGIRSVVPDTLGINNNKPVYFERSEQFLVPSLSLLITSDNKEGLFPLGKISFGYTQSGMILRVMSGLSYQINSSLELNSGIEYNECFYNAIDGRSANSRKLNFIYSLNYHF